MSMASPRPLQPKRVYWEALSVLLYARFEALRWGRAHAVGWVRWGAMVTTLRLPPSPSALRDAAYNVVVIGAKSTDLRRSPIRPSALNPALPKHMLMSVCDRAGHTYEPRGVLLH